MTNVFIVNGKPRAGKDTLIRFMTDVLKDRGIYTASFSSIDPIKIMLKGAGFDLEAKTEADRKLLSIIGDAVEEHSSFRTQACLEVVDRIRQKTVGAVIFLHIREPHNIAKVREKLIEEGHKVFRVSVISDRSEDITSNPSDAGTWAMPYDFQVVNNGTLGDLYDEAVALVDLVHLRRPQQVA